MIFESKTVNNYDLNFSKKSEPSDNSIASAVFGGKNEIASSYTR